MFLRREALNKSGLLDESFFMYGEDIDLSYRITLTGYENYYVPSSIIHYKGESTKKESFKYVYTFYDAMVIFFKKHFPHYSLVFSLSVKVVIYLRALVAVLRRMMSRFMKKKPFEYRFLVLGGEKTLRDVRSICERNNLQGRHHYVLAGELSTPEGHLNLGLPLEEYTHVVYDTDSFSNSKILTLLERSAEHYKLGLGTYSSQSKVLITSQQLFQ